MAVAAESITARTYPFWFVIGDAEKKSKSGNILEVTYRSMLKSNFNVMWAAEEECLDVQRKEPETFVMSTFSGPAFEHLVSLNCRIIGPLCLYSCLRNEEVFPRRSHPLYSTAMKDVTVCCTKLSTSARSEIHQKVEYMCGKYSEDFTSDVTHLICDEVGSKKYHVAASFGLPIMLPEWVEDVWNNSQHKLIHGNALSYNDFRCPIFKGLTICVSQLSVEERNFIKKVVENEGGFYTTTLEMTINTHLILFEAKGEKFEAAKEWKLFCVHEDWFYDSLEAGYCMDENLYPPKKEGSELAPDPETMDCCSGVEESMELDISNSAVPKTLVKKEIPSLEILDSFRVNKLPENSDFLDACNIYIHSSDFSDSHMKKLHKIINAGGGTRFSMCSAGVTHVVCANKNDKLIDFLKASSSGAHVVSFDWLLECCEEQRLIDATPFSFMENSPLSPDNEGMIPCEAENVKQKQSNCAESQNPEPLFDMDDLMKQYLPD